MAMSVTVQEIKATAYPQDKEHHGFLAVEYCSIKLHEKVFALVDTNMIDF